MQASGEAGCACADQNKAANVRKIFNKNERARISCDQRTKVIDLERKVTCARISREERDLRSQLGRLEEQRKFAATDETAEYLTRYLADSLHVDDGNNEAAIHICLDSTSEVVNPYPVTIGRARKLSVTASTERISPATSSTRLSRESQDFEEAYLASPSGRQLLPPIGCQSRNNLVSGSTYTALRKNSSGSCVSGQLSLATAGARGDQEAETPEIWVGDPEAISSVRRNRKSPARQRFERCEKNANRWARSRSLKEGANIHRRDASSSSLSRSHSMKDPNNFTISNLVTRRRSVPRCGTALSRTSSIGKTSSECSLDEDQI